MCESAALYQAGGYLPPHPESEPLGFFVAKENIEAHAKFIETIQSSFREYENWAELHDLAGQASGNRIYDWYANTGHFVNRVEYEEFFELLDEMTENYHYVLALRKDVQDIILTERYEQGRESL